MKMSSQWEVGAKETNWHYALNWKSKRTQAEGRVWSRQGRGQRWRETGKKNLLFCKGCDAKTDQQVRGDPLFEAQNIKKAISQKAIQLQTEQEIAKYVPILHWHFFWKKGQAVRWGQERSDWISSRRVLRTVSKCSNSLVPKKPHAQQYFVHKIMKTLHLHYSNFKERKIFLHVLMLNSF